MKRALTLLVLLPIAGLVAGSCREVVSPEPVALLPSLCDLLRQCEGADAWSCPSSVVTPFEGLDEEARTDAYALFLDHDCLADCRSARECRDLHPLCGPLGTECTEDSACCGYTAGIAECRGAEEGSCCAPDGAPCNGGGCCQGDCNDNHCGDFACTLVGKTCETHFECCTKRCDFTLGDAPDNGLCALNTCSIVGEPCEVADDCCDDAATCEAGELPGQRFCSISSCNDGCDPFDTNNCCVVEGLGVCYLLLNDETVCGDQLCPPAGVECGGDPDCSCESEGGSLICDDAAFPHCAECRSGGATCDPLAEDPLCCNGGCDAETSTCAL